MERVVTVRWQGIDVEAANPDRIADWMPELAERTVRRTEQASAAVQRVGDRSIGAFEVVARLLLRSEGLASSAIEGLRASAADVAIAEADHDIQSVAGWVADNLVVVNDALVDAGPLDSTLLFEWHTRLMRSSPTIEERHVGAYRDTLGWIGGTNPRLAAHVAAPEDLIPELMEDLFAFIERTDIDPITQAAVAHSQFETIHPFADGNGRLGRVLIGRILSQRLSVPVPPPISLQMARDVGGYQAGLTLFRQGLIDAWITWFADAVTFAANRASEVLTEVDELRSRWRASTEGLRRDSTALRLCELLPAHPVVSSSSTALLLDVSEQSARVALGSLVDLDVLIESERRSSGPGRPRRWYVAHELLNLIGR